MCQATKAGHNLPGDRDEPRQSPLWEADSGSVNSITITECVVSGENKEAPGWAPRVFPRGHLVGRKAAGFCPT
jgi:hypothetical protein